MGVIPAVNSNDTPMPLLPDAASLDGSCKCQLRFNKYGRQGCIIEEPAPKGKGCLCVHTIFPDDPDEPERCDAQGTEWCMNPDKSVFSCDQELIVNNDHLINGNCRGYNTDTADAECKCRRVENSLGEEGCIITEAAPEFLSCKCVEVLGSWCAGTVVQCLDWEDPLCDNPDTSLESCLLASGTVPLASGTVPLASGTVPKNCEGYK